MEEGSNALSVSAAMGIAKRQLEDITVRVIGEVSEFSSNPRYKAVYFTVKDEKSSLPCMMWSNRYTQSGVQLQVGALVEMVGRFTLYAAKGRMNFDAFSIELAGEGKLRMQVANLAKRLEAEGLMSQERKRSLPEYPSVIGLVTSPRGAAVHDVLRTLRRRFPMSRIVFAGVGVEGASAPSGIMEGLAAVQDAGAEVILLVRGGGSFEDLMPFNDEGLARFISSMEAPVVTGIGHEPDTSIADLVADLRASTPTAAAEAVAPAQSDISSSLRERARRMHGTVSGRLASSGRILDRYSMMPLFREPMRLFQDEAQRLDEMMQRLGTSIPRGLANSQERLDAARESLLLGLSSLLPPVRTSLSTSRTRMLSDGKALVMPYGGKVASASAKLDALSPLGVLARGYSIAMAKDGSIMRSIADARTGSAMSVQLSDGILSCEVTGSTKRRLVMEGSDD